MIAVSSSAGEARVSRRARARLDLLFTAERLFATHGLENVSLRQIASEAGYANPATIQYHFGSKEGLVEAIIDHHLPDIDRRRMELLDQFAENDVRGVAEAMARPYLELDASSHYAGFVGRMALNLDAFSGAYDSAIASRGGRRIRGRLDTILADVSPAVRATRMNFATVVMGHSIANRRARAAAGRRVTLSEEAFAEELITAMVAVLQH